MQARLSEMGEVVVVRLIGRVGVEATDRFRDACATRLAGRKVVFDFKQLSFVGSSGLVPFLETLQSFARCSAAAVGFSAVGPEFQRLLSATALGAIPAFAEAEEAARAISSAAPAMAGQGEAANDIFLDRGTDDAASAEPGEEACPPAIPLAFEPGAPA
jgi:anti-anti-sigma factor